MERWQHHDICDHIIKDIRWNLIVYIEGTVMLPLAGVEAFVAVVRTGSFVRAAASLDLSTSAVSRSLARLELALGVRLLQRTTRTVGLTDEGRAYHAHCEHLLDAFQQAGEAVQLHRATPVGRLRVEMSVSFGRLVLLPAVPAFLRAHPKLELQFGLSDRIVDLVEEGIDAAVRVGELRDSTLVAQTVGETRWTTVAAPALLAGQKAVRRPADLERFTRVDFFYASTGKARPWYFESNGERVELPSSARLTIGGGEALVDAAVQGMGVVQTLDYLVEADLRAGRLVRLLRAWEAPGPPISVVYPSGRYVSARARAFTEFVREALRQSQGRSAA
jgi:LysR family transcriptional regulator for bpeEF and oprC